MADLASVTVESSMPTSPPKRLRAGGPLQAQHESLVTDLERIFVLRAVDNDPALAAAAIHAFGQLAGAAHDALHEYAAAHYPQARAVALWDDTDFGDFEPVAMLDADGNEVAGAATLRADRALNRIVADIDIDRWGLPQGAERPIVALNGPA